MKMISKYLFMIVALTMSTSVVLAQDTSTTGQIVMTKAQLESFLTKVAQLRKEQIVKQRETDLLQLERNTTSPAGAPGRRAFSYDGDPAAKAFGITGMDGAERRITSSAEGRILDRLELLNAKLDAVANEMDAMKLRARLNSNTNYSDFDELPLSFNRQQPQQGGNSTLQPVIINQGTPSQPYINYVPEPNFSLNGKRGEQYVVSPQDLNSDSAVQERAKLTERITGLESQLSLLQQLKKGADTTETNQYDTHISDISSQIAALEQQLKEATEQAHLALERKEKNLTALLREFSYKVYFENNSTTIPPSDFSRLKDIVRTALNNRGVTVVLRGFASKTGSPAYNERISYQRTASVRDWLLKNGLRPNDIITMHYGEDTSVDASRARRVEISFRVQ